MSYGVNHFLEGSHGSQLALEGSRTKEGTGGNFFSGTRACRQNKEQKGRILRKIRR